MPQIKHSHEIWMIKFSSFIEKLYLGLIFFTFERFIFSLGAWLELLFDQWSVLLLNLILQFNNLKN